MAHPPSFKVLRIGNSEDDPLPEDGGSFRRPAKPRQRCNVAVSSSKSLRHYYRDADLDHKVQPLSQAEDQMLVKH